MDRQATGQPRSLPWHLTALWALFTGLGAAFVFIPTPLPLTLGQFAGLTPAGYLALIALCFLGIQIGIFSGAIIGLSQWLILRKLLAWDKRNAGWLLGTLGGMTVAWSVGSVTAIFATLYIDFPPEETSRLVEPDSSTLAELLVRGAAVGIIVGAILGIAQWAILRKWVSSSRLWMFASIIAWGAGWVVYHFAYMAMEGPLSWPTYGSTMTWDQYDAARFPAHLTGWLVAALVIGIITAIAIRALISPKNQRIVESAPGE